MAKPVIADGYETPVDMADAIVGNAIAQLSRNALRSTIDFRDFWGCPAS